MRCYNSSRRQNIADRVVKYIEKMELDDYPGGVPTTVFHSGEFFSSFCLEFSSAGAFSSSSNAGCVCSKSTKSSSITFISGEQWDWPNVWAPMQHMLIVGLDNLCDDRTKKIAQSWAQRWVQGNYLAYKDTNAMFEKVRQSTTRRTLIDFGRFSTWRLNLVDTEAVASTKCRKDSGESQMQNQSNLQSKSPSSCRWTNGALRPLWRNFDCLIRFEFQSKNLS
jgi:hypothetical protein